MGIIQPRRYGENICLTVTDEHMTQLDEVYRLSRELTEKLGRLNIDIDKLASIETYSIWELGGYSSEVYGAPFRGLLFEIDKNVRHSFCAPHQELDYPIESVKFMLRNLLHGVEPEEVYQLSSLFERIQIIEEYTLPEIIKAIVESFYIAYYSKADHLMAYTSRCYLLNRLFELDIKAYTLFSSVDRIKYKQHLYHPKQVE